MGPFTGQDIQALIHADKLPPWLQHNQDLVSQAD